MTAVKPNACSELLNISRLSRFVGTSVSRLNPFEIYWRVECKRSIKSRVGEVREFRGMTAQFSSGFQMREGLKNGHD